MTIDVAHGPLGARLEGHTLDLPLLRRRTCDLLNAHVPLLLLLDLSDPDGPDSAGCYAHEGGDAGWLGLSPAGAVR